MKKFLIIFSWAMGLGLWSLNQSAEAEENFTYDLEIGGEQSSYIEIDAGENILITVEEVDEPVFSKDQVGLFSTMAAVQNKSYLIKGSAAFVWNASYKINVSNRLITRAYDYQASATAGKFIHRKLSLSSTNKRAALELIMERWTGTRYNIELAASIVGSELVVTY